jgi:hypothetical protein
MIRVEKQPEPRLPQFDFDGQVRQPGQSALAELTGKPPTIDRPGPRMEKRAERIEDLDPGEIRKHPYWTRALDALHTSYRGVCAYSCIRMQRLLGPTVDHFVAITRAELPQAYEWDNYRLACSLMNARKGNFSDVLDPCTIEDGWFELDLNTLEVKPADALDPATKQSVEDTIDRLGLNSRECVNARQERFDEYWQPDDPDRPIPLWHLEKWAPFLAREMRRQGRIRPEDTR